MRATVIRYPPNVDLRQPPRPTWWQRLMQRLNPPPKAEVFRIENPRLEIARRRKERRRAQ